MALKEPEGMNECLYFTRSKFALDKGGVMAWVMRKECPECHKGLMGKPKKTAQEYLCKECKYSETKKDHEAECQLNIKYTCPFCAKDGEATVPYVRKTLYGKKAFCFKCEHCSEKLGVYKRMGVPKKFLEKIGAE